MCSNHSHVKDFIFHSKLWGDFFFSKKLNISFNNNNNDNKLLHIFSFLLKTPVLLHCLLYLVHTCSQGNKNKVAASKSGIGIWLEKLFLTWDMMNCPAWHHQGLISKEAKNNGGTVKDAHLWEKNGRWQVLGTVFYFNQDKSFKSFFITTCIHTRCYKCVAPVKATCHFPPFTL